MEEVKVRELPEKPKVISTDYIIVEDEDGTKKTLAKNFRSLVLTSLYFNSIDDLKNSYNHGLKEGDICETLGYYVPGDGGGAKYKITYNPAAVEDGKLVHYLSYSDTLRAEIVLDDSINVHQFGAIGNGKTDDTDAIQAAIDNSDNRIIEFSNNKKYVVKGGIKINKSNTVINGNGGIILPYYINGFEIMPEEDSDTLVENVIINNLHFDCTNALSAIYTYKAFRVNINECVVTNADIGLHIESSVFVNIDKCHLTGNNVPKESMLILIDGAVIEKSPDLAINYINIDNCKFDDFYKGIRINEKVVAGEVNDEVINITNCHYNSSKSYACCIDIQSPTSLVNLSCNSVNYSHWFLMSNLASNISCRDILCINVTNVFYITGATATILNLYGSINVNATAIMFDRFVGKLYSTVMWGLLAIGATYNETVETQTKLYDSIHPTQYNDTMGYSFSGSTLSLNELRNVHIDWTSTTNNLTTIKGGIEGQLIYIKSSTGKSIIGDTTGIGPIQLSDSSTPLTRHKGVLLRCINDNGLKWKQVQ